MPGNDEISPRGDWGVGFKFVFQVCFSKQVEKGVSFAKNFQEGSLRPCDGELLQLDMLRATKINAAKTLNPQTPQPTTTIFTTTIIICVGSDCKALYRNYREPTKTWVLAVPALRNPGGLSDRH